MTGETEKMSKPIESKDATNALVTMDRRRNERRNDNQDQPAIANASGRRRKVQRRRQIDPTTCERDYSNDEIEFMQAMDAYKRAAGRMFPTCSEVLEVVRSLGYVRLNADQLDLLNTLQPSQATNDLEATFEDESDEESLFEVELFSDR